MAIKKIFVRGEPIREEKKADAAITPGHLCEITSTGVKVHATAGGRAYALFAEEDYLQGNEIGTAYTTANRVLLGTAPPGAFVYAIIKDGEDIAVGDFLESGGSGELREVDADPSVGTVVTGSVIAVAEAALDLSGSSGADPASARCLVRIV